MFVLVCNCLDISNNFNIVQSMVKLGIQLGWA